MHALLFTDIKKAKTTDFKFEPQLITLIVHDKEYDKREKILDEWKTIKAQPSTTELFWCKVIDKFVPDLDKYYSGAMMFSQSDAVDKIIFEGLNSKGNKVSDEVIQNFIDEAFSFDVVEPKLLTGIDTKQEAGGDGKKNYQGYSKGQSEKDRLTDRWEFLKFHTAPASDTCTNATELAVLLSGSPDDPVKVYELHLWIIRTLMQS